MSERKNIADEIAELINRTGMTRAVGGDVEQDERCYSILFTKPQSLDGLVRVFGPRFILIQCSGPQVPGSNWSAVYETKTDALRFLEMLAAGFADVAADVPHRTSIKS